MSMEESPKPGVRFSELLLALQQEIQQTTEYLSLEKVRTIDKEQAPSAGFVIANKIAVRLPVVLELQDKEIPMDWLQRYRIPMKPFLRALEETENQKEGLQGILILNVRIPSDREPPTGTTGELSIEFLVSAK